MKPSLNRSPAVIALLLVAVFAAPAAAPAQEGNVCVSQSGPFGLYTNVQCADGCKEMVWFWEEGYCDPPPAEAE